jgi:hypothetical protein
MVNWPLKDDWPLKGTRYELLQPLAPPPDDQPDWGRSDLYLRGRKDIIIRLQHDQGTGVESDSGYEVAGPLRIWDGHWLRAGDKCPEMRFLPSTVRVIDDLSALFEPQLIEADVNSHNVFAVTPEGPSARSFYLPFKKEMTGYLEAGVLGENTSVRTASGNAFAVRVRVPLSHGYWAVATRRYENTDVVKLERYVQTYLVAWPEFVCDDWAHYLYYKYDQESDSAKSSMVFDPIGDVQSTRRAGTMVWYWSKKPLKGFVATVGDAKGLLLIRQKPIGNPTRYWRVAVDFGSSHTRAFRIAGELSGEEEFRPLPNPKVLPIVLESGVQELTHSAVLNVWANFMAWDADPLRILKEEINSHLLLPVVYQDKPKDWLPRDGHIFRHSVLEVGFPKLELRTNLKWNANRDDYDLRAFLRCLTLLIKAQATREGAKIWSIGHAYPSVFEGTVLEQKQADEWAPLDPFLGGLTSGSDTSPTGIGVRIEEPLMEAVAVARHLNAEQGATPKTNVVALDVGGGTTDIAIWRQNKLARQESIKFAAGLLGAYLQQDRRFQKEFLRYVREGAPLNLPVSQDWDDWPERFPLLFHAILKYATTAGHLRSVITQVNSNPNGFGHPFVAHLIYLFSALSYYVGILGRKEGMADEALITLYVCGRGGTFCEWINNYRSILGSAFRWGLGGPAAPARSAQVSVITRVSTCPKEEVGRGILANSLLAPQPRQVTGLVDLSPRAVIAGEDGYPGLLWDSELTRDDILRLQKGAFPTVAALKELLNFVDHLQTDSGTRLATQLLKISTPGQDFLARLQERLLGLGPASESRAVSEAEQAILEPLFVTETKVLLETCTGNYSLFQ